MSEDIDAEIAELTAVAESLMRAVEALKRRDRALAEQILTKAEARTAIATRSLGSTNCGK